MIGAIYTGLSGMTAFSRGLDTISNNVANLNTPGFKSSEALFSELVFQSTGGSVPGSAGAYNRGAGVSADQTRTSFRQGELRNTGNSLDVAIDGNGFFVLDRDGERLYTRAGQFEFNQDGVLVDRRTQAQVIVVTDSTGPAPFDIDDLRVFAPRATVNVNLSGTLARGGTNTTFNIPQFTVIDTAGGSQTLSARFVRDAADPLSWTIEVLNSRNEVLGNGTIMFDANGTPSDGANSVAIVVRPQDLPEFTINLNAGAVGSFSGITAPPAGTVSQVQVQRQDGLAIGSLTAVEFDDDGKLRLTYSNGETETVATLLLARVNSAEQLRALGNEVFVAAPGQQPVLGTARVAGLGRTVGGQVELSNVELTEQFTDLIIVQRGYQASSQMTSVANEMLQQLLALQDRR
jgi:flagellar hook protein FlgE